MDLAVSLRRRSGPLPLSPISDFYVSNDVGEAKVQTEIGTGGKSAFRNDGNGDQEDESEDDSEPECLDGCDCGDRSDDEDNGDGDSDGNSDEW
jgi:hypothetical protein